MLLLHPWVIFLKRREEGIKVLLHMNFMDYLTIKHLQSLVTLSSQMVSLFHQKLVNLWLWRNRHAGSGDNNILSLFIFSLNSMSSKAINKEWARSKETCDLFSVFICLCLFVLISDLCRTYMWKELLFMDDGIWYKSFTSTIDSRRMKPRSTTFFAIRLQSIKHLHWWP